MTVSDLMPAQGTFPAPDTRSDWVRLRTLILLRWAAITGQVVTILVAAGIYDIDLKLAHCFLIVGAAVAANLVSMLAFPATKRLTEAEAMLTFLFDSVQLAALLALTGGLANPFALLILAPVTIAATTLQTRATVLVGGVTIALITVVAFFHLPLATREGTEISVPRLFEFGFWLAIVIGVVFLGLYARRVASEMHAMQDALLATQMALAREQRLTALGGVVAAAAHELGTPLATIKLASSELADELADRPDLRADAELIRGQADRCRDILHSMGRAGKDDLHLRTAPLSAVIREAAVPHERRGRTIRYAIPATNADGLRQPHLYRKPEVIHGLRNLVQNAVDFAASNVWIDADWSATEMRIVISDDGPGFPPELLGRIGDPYVHGRRPHDLASARPEYDGMGLGLFIAKTLLERSGASLRVANGADPFLNEGEAADRSGAIVIVTLPREIAETRDAPALGQNAPFLS